MRPGDVAIVPPNVQHHLLAAPDSRTFTVKIRRSAFESVFSSLMQGGTPLSSYISDVLYARHYHNCLTFHCGGDPFLPDLIRHMTEQQTQKKSCWHQVLEGLLTTFFAYIVQNYGEAVEFFAGDNAQSDRISAVEAYLRRNFSTATLTGTAEHFFLSPSYLSALIKSQTGHTFSSILQRIRMDRAVELLTGTDRKVSWICEQVGYQDTTQFNPHLQKTLWHYAPSVSKVKKRRTGCPALLLSGQPVPILSRSVPGCRFSQRTQRNDRSPNDCRSRTTSKSGATNFTMTIYSPFLPMGFPVFSTSSMTVLG